MSKPLHFQGFYIQFPQPLTLAHNMLPSAIQRQVFTSVIKKLIGFSSFHKCSPSYSGLQGIFCISYSNLLAQIVNSGLHAVQF